MTCRPCAYVANLALVADMLASALLGGRAGDTISQRTARARPARWAVGLCSTLTWISRTVFRADRDHCDWSLSDTGTLGAETWDWTA